MGYWEIVPRLCSFIYFSVLRTANKMIRNQTRGLFLWTLGGGRHDSNMLNCKSSHHNKWKLVIVTGAMKERHITWPNEILSLEFQTGQGRLPWGGDLELLPEVWVGVWMVMRVEKSALIHPGMKGVWWVCGTDRRPRRDGEADEARMVEKNQTRQSHVGHVRNVCLYLRSNGSHQICVLGSSFKLLSGDLIGTGPEWT